MLFWIVAGTLAALVAATVAGPLLAPRAWGGGAEPDIAFYRDQLAEVGRDLARGTLPPAEAERARVEIARRLLAADRAGPRPEAPAPRAATALGAGAVAVVMVMGGLGLYAALGRPGAADAPRAARLAAAEAARAARPAQAEAEARAQARAAARGPMDAPTPSPDYAALIDDLRRVVAARPDDLRGWELLALHEARLGRHADAARAQERVVALKGDEVDAADLVALLDRLVAAAGGSVSPEAEAVLGRLAALDARSAGGRYYAGLLHAQTGRPDLAFPLWRAVVEEGPAEGLHHALARAGITDVAWLAGSDWTPPPEAGAEPGPSPADVAAAAAMEPEDREAMIRGMVEGLADRLRAEGGPPADWVRLVASLEALGETEAAAAAYGEAREAAGDDAASIEALRRAAEAAGIGPAVAP